MTGDDAAGHLPATGKLGRRREGRTGSQDTSPSAPRDGGVRVACRHPALRGVTHEPIGLIFALVPSCRSWPSATRGVRSEPETIVVIETIVIVDRVRPEAARDRERALGDAPFVTIIHPDEHPATASVADAVGDSGRRADALARRASARTSRSRVRGAAPGHTAVLIDGVPLARIAAVTTDLGRFALDAFGEVELYRGAVPVELGGAGRRRCAQPRDAARARRARRARAGVGRRWLVRRAPPARPLRRRPRGGELLSSTTIGYQGATRRLHVLLRQRHAAQPERRRVSRSARTTASIRSTSLARRRAPTEPPPVACASRTSDRACRAARRSPRPTASLVDDRRDRRCARRRRASAPATRARARLRAGRAPAPARSDRRARARRAGARLPHDVGRRVVDVARARSAASRDRGARAARRSLPRLAMTRRDAAGAHRRSRRRCAARGGRSRARSRRAARRHAGDAARRAAHGTDADDRRARCARADPGARDVVPSPRLSARALARPGCLDQGERRLVRAVADADRAVRRSRHDPRLARAACPSAGRARDVGFVVAPSHAVRIPNGDLPDLVIDRIFVEAAGSRRARTTRSRSSRAAGFVVRAMNIADAQTYGARARRVGAVRADRVADRELHAARHRAARRPIRRSRTSRCRASPGHALYARADVVRTAFGRRGDGVVRHELAVRRRSSIRRACSASRRACCSARAFASSSAASSALSLAVANLADVADRAAPARTRRRAPISPTRRRRSPMSPGFPLPGRSFYLSLDWSH